MLSIFSRPTVFIAVVALTVTSCGSSNGDARSQTNSKNSKANTALVPASDEFTFQNFGAASSPEQFGSSDLIAMFGPNVCNGGNTSSCQLTAEVAAWAQLVNQSRMSGHCEGMVVEVQHRFNSSASPKTATLTNSADTSHAIFRAFASQFLPEVDDITDSWAGKSLSEKVNALRDSLSAGKIQYSMGLYSPVGGHAVLPYSMEYSDNNHVTIHIYDSNWPKADRFVTVDVKSGTWSFPFSGADPTSDPQPWTGKKGDMDLTPIDSRLSARSPFTKGDNAITGNFLVIKSMKPTWSIATTHGTLSPTAPLNEDGRVRPLRTIGTNGEREYVVRTNVATIAMRAQNGTSAFVFNKKGSYRVKTVGSESSISISEGSISSATSSANIAMATDDLAISVNGVESTISNRANTLSVSGPDFQRPFVVNAANPQLTVSKLGNQLQTSVGSDIATATDQSSPVAPTTTTAPKLATTTTSLPTSTTAQKLTTTTTSVTPNPASLQVALTPQVRSGFTIGTIPVRILDVTGRQLFDATGNVTATLSGAGGVLSGTTVVSISNGLASFSNLTLTGTVGATYSLTFSTAQGVTTSISFVLLA